MKRVLKIGGVLAGLAVLAAGGLYAAYKSGIFRSTSTKHGAVSTVNEATTPAPRAKPKPTPSWPYFRYDERRLGVNPGAQARPPFRVKWSLPVPSRGYLEAPAVVQDGVLVIGSYGKALGSDVTGIDAEKGRILWRRHFPHPSDFAGSAGISAGRVYITGHDGFMRVFDLHSGRALWKMHVAATESPPIVSGGLVYFGDGPVGGGNGTFRAVDVKTHRVRWSYKSAGNISSGASLTGTTAYWSSYGGHVYAVNRFTGKLRWDTAVQGASGGTVPFYSTPALDGGKLVVGGNDGSIYALNARTGAQDWRYDGSGYVYCSASIYKGTVYIGDFGGSFHALSLKSGHQRWSYSMGPVIGSATIIRGIVYIASLRPAKTYGLSARTGKLLWTFPDGQFSPVVADRDRIWLTGKHRVYGFVMRKPKRKRPAVPPPLRASGTVNAD